MVMLKQMANKGSNLAEPNDFQKFGFFPKQRQALNQPELTTMHDLGVSNMMQEHGMQS